MHRAVYIEVTSVMEMGLSLGKWRLIQVWHLVCWSVGAIMKKLYSYAISIEA